jgi:hypothetical protein
MMLKFRKVSINDPCRSYDFLSRAAAKVPASLSCPLKKASHDKGRLFYTE